jgi:nicotinate-nucleotide adenylyltransferase
MAEEAKKRLNLKEVWLLVNPQNPHKNKADIADFEHRAALCEIIAKKHPWLKVSYFEEGTNSAYTAETLQKIKKHYKNTRFIWLMGTDNMKNFHKWQNWQEIMHHTSIVIFSREKADGRRVYAQELHSPAFCRYAKNRVRGKTKLDFSPQWRIMFTPNHIGRATEIRKELQQDSSSLHLTPEQMISPHLEAGYRGGGHTENR